MANSYIKSEKLYNLFNTLKKLHEKTDIFLSKDQSIIQWPSFRLTYKQNLNHQKQRIKFS